MHPLLREEAKSKTFTFSVEPPESFACTISFVQFADDEAGLRIQESEISGGRVVYAKPARAEAAHIIISLDAGQQTRYMYVRASHVRKLWQSNTLRTYIHMYVTYIHVITEQH